MTAHPLPFATTEDEPRPNKNKNPKKTDISFVYIGTLRVKTGPIENALSNENFTKFKIQIEKMQDNGTRSAGTITNQIRTLNNFFKINNQNEITVKNIKKFINKYSSNPNQVSNLKSIILHFHRIKLIEIPEEVITLLKQTVSHRATAAGKRIRSENPEEGWYTEEEYTELVSTIWNDFEYDKNCLWNTVACLLCARYGRRPVQLSQLKIMDLKNEGSDQGLSGKRIHFPGVKDKGTGCFRSSKFEIHPMDETLWKLCQALADKSIEKFENALNITLDKFAKNNLPLFYPRRNSIKSKFEFALHKSNDFRTAISSQFLHSSPISIGKAIQRDNLGTKTTSSRTGNYLVENAYRFRYTRARQLARLGVSKAVLQHWLGHETQFSLENYYSDPAEDARKINEQMGPLLAPLAQAFHGVIRDKEQDAIRGDDPSSRIEVNGNNESSVGTCGEYGFCNASVPIPCYRCSKFQPWVYGPHQEVLQQLLKRKKDEESALFVGTTRRVILPAMLDDDIQAVKHIISLCEKRKNELNGKN